MEDITKDKIAIEALKDAYDNLSKESIDALSKIDAKTFLETLFKSSTFVDTNIRHKDLISTLDNMCADFYDDLKLTCIQNDPKNRDAALSNIQEFIKFITSGDYDKLPEKIRGVIEKLIIPESSAPCFDIRILCYNTHTAYNIPMEKLMDNFAFWHLMGQTLYITNQTSPDMAVFRDMITPTGACIKQNYMNLLIQFIMTVINYISYEISITKPKSDEIRYLKIEEIQPWYMQDDEWLKSCKI